MNILIFLSIEKKINTYKKNLIPNSFIRFNFLLDGKLKEIIVNKYELKQFYLFIRIYYNNNFITFVINKLNQFEEKEILHKINDIGNLKNAIKINLKINEFPLINYYLKEKNTLNIDKDIDKAYTLEKMLNNRNQINNNIFMGNINQDLNRDRLEKLLNEEKEENVLLNNKIEALENTLNSKIKKN